MDDKAAKNRGILAPEQPKGLENKKGNAQSTPDVSTSRQINACWVCRACSVGMTSLISTPHFYRWKRVPLRLIRMHFAHLDCELSSMIVVFYKLRETVWPFFLALFSWTFFFRSFISALAMILVMLRSINRSRDTNPMRKASREV